MSPTSDPFKLFMEESEKTQSLSDKCIKSQLAIASIKEDMNKINDLNVPTCKQILDHAIKHLYEEHEKAFAEIKDILKNLKGITDVNTSPEEMIRIFENLSLASTNTVVQPPAVRANATNTVVKMQDQQRLSQMRMQQLQKLLQQGLRQGESRQLLRQQRILQYCHKRHLLKLAKMQMQQQRRQQIRQQGD